MARAEARTLEMLKNYRPTYQKDHPRHSTGLLLIDPVF